MSSFEARINKLITFIDKDKLLLCQLNKCFNISHKTECIIYYLDKDLKKIFQAAKLHVTAKDNWKSVISSDIFHDKNICYFNEWLLTNENAEWLLSKDSITHLSVKNLNFVVSDSVKDCDIKKAIRCIEQFRRLLREQFHVYIREAPHILLKQYWNYIKYHLNDIILCQTNINTTFKLLQWFDEIYYKLYAEKLKGQAEQKLDKLLFQINPDLINLEFQKKTIDSKELIGINLYFFLFFILAHNLHFFLFI